MRPRFKIQYPMKNQGKNTMRFPQKQVQNKAVLILRREDRVEQVRYPYNCVLYFARNQAMLGMYNQEQKHSFTKSSYA